MIHMSLFCIVHLVCYDPLCGLDGKPKLCVCEREKFSLVEKHVFFYLALLIKRVEKMLLSSKIVKILVGNNIFLTL